MTADVRVSAQDSLSGILVPNDSQKILLLAGQDIQVPVPVEVYEFHPVELDALWPADVSGFPA